MPIRLSYINARGEEAILDDDEGTFAHELQGREGFESPTLNLKEHKYGDGTTDVVSITLKERKVTCYFWADPPDISHWEEKFEEIKAILIQTGQKEDEWGKLRIRMEDGHYVYLNCVYEKGLDDIVRDNSTRIKFALTFKATDPYFYNGFDYSYTIKQDDRSGYLFFDNAVIVSTMEEAIAITEEEQPGNLWWQVRRNGEYKYYAIVPDRTIYEQTAIICDTTEEAILETGEEDPGNLWWETTFLRTEYLDTEEEAIAYTGDEERGSSWWPIKIDGEQKYKAEKTETKYYAIVKRMCLYMSSAQSNNGQDLYIQCEKVYPNVIINGPARNIILENHSTGRKIALDVNIQLDVNEKISICTTPLKRRITKTSKEGVVTNLIPWLSADSTLDWWLIHGQNNIEFTNSETTPESYLKFIYTERIGSVK